MAFKKILLVAAAALLAAPCLTALADEAGEYTFTVLRDGDPVGQHRVVFDREGDRIEIREATEIEVRFAMIPVYSFKHERREVWEHGRALRIDARTEKDGEILDITVRPSGGGYVRTINGRVDKFNDSMKILAFWSKDSLKNGSFFSVVEDKTLDLSFQYVGLERIALAGKELEAEHYRMVGDEERDLWFDMAGHVAKVQLRRLGSDIEYLRDQLKPEATCTTAC